MMVSNLTGALPAMASEVVSWEKETVNATVTQNGEGVERGVRVGVGVGGGE